MALMKGIIPENNWYYKPGYQLLVFIVSFAVPLIAISFCYFFMFKEVSRQQKQLPKFASSEQEESVDIKAIKTIGIFYILLQWDYDLDIELDHTDRIFLSFVLTPTVHSWHFICYQNA